MKNFYFHLKVMNFEKIEMYLNDLDYKQLGV